MKSLELNWLRKKVDKSIPIPEVVYHPLENAGGQYYPPDNYELYDPDGKPYSMRYGVIVIDPEYKPYQSTIAHEWRHHWQEFNGIKYDTPEYVDDDDYCKQVKKYYSTSKAELDALRFQYKYAGFDGPYKEWEEMLYPILKDLMVNPIITYGNNISKYKHKKV